MPSTREFSLPDLGEGLVDAQILTWLVRVGEVISVDQPIVEVETAKATIEVPCPHAGTVSELCAAEGDTVAVGHPLIRVTETTTSADPAPDREAGKSFTASRHGQATSGQILAGYGISGEAGSERGRKRWSSRFEPVASVRTPVVSPVVRKLARVNGVDLETVTGTGPQGLILRSDVERATAEPISAVQPNRVPLHGIRAAAAAKFTRSRQEIPHVTCWRDADATELLGARTLLNDDDGEHIGLLALLARICVAALARYPQFNSTVDAKGAEIIQWPHVHLGFAAQSARGLVVPVVRDAQLMSTEELATAVDDLTTKARAGTLSPNAFSGGTFTVNNYGVFGADGATPILDHPQAAMLGIGRITEKPWTRRGRLVVAHTVQLSLTFDHRVCDGREAGAFLRLVAECVERPLRLLRHC